MPTDANLTDDKRKEEPVPVSPARAASKSELLNLVISGAVAVAALVLPLMVYYSTRLNSVGISLHETMVMHDQLDALERRLVDAQKQAQLMRELSEKLSASPPATAQIAQLTAQVDSIQSQLKLLNDAIGQSPDKAVALPLLKKDLDNLRESYRHDFDNTQVELNRVYDQNRWFIGLMVTMALALFSLAATNFLRFRKGEAQ